MHPNGKTGVSLNTQQRSTLLERYRKSGSRKPPQPFKHTGQRGIAIRLIDKKLLASTRCRITDNIDTGSPWIIVL